MWLRQAGRNVKTVICGEYWERHSPLSLVSLATLVGGSGCVARLSNEAYRAAAQTGLGQADALVRTMIEEVP